MNKKMVILIVVLLLCGCGKKTTYFCPNGDLDGSECVIEERKDAYTSCRDGYTKVGYVCKERVDAVANVECPEGYYPESGVCVNDENIERTYTYSCESISGDNIISATLDNDTKMCNVKACEEFADEDKKKCKSVVEYTEESNQIANKCPSGTEEIFGVCKKYVYGRTKYSCPEGKNNGKYCILDKTVSLTYSCDDEDELMGTECFHYNRVPARVKET